MASQTGDEYDKKMVGYYNIYYRETISSQSNSHCIFISTT